jgi:hypothetical protein
VEGGKEDDEWGVLKCGAARALQSRRKKPHLPPLLCCPPPLIFFPHPTPAQVTFRAGDVVVRQGDAQADRFYIVEEGECKAEMEGVAGEVCARMGRGAYFGERALLTDAPRAATVTAVVDTKCLAMDRAAFVRIMGPLSDLLRRNMEVYDKFVSN